MSEISEQWVTPLTTPGLDTTLGLRATTITRDQVIVMCDLGPEHLQPFGIVHGGLYAALVESAASIAANTWLGHSGTAAGVSNQTDFYRSVSTGTIIAVATPIHRGRRQQVWQVEIRGDHDDLVARGQLRLINTTH